MKRTSHARRPAIASRVESELDPPVPPHLASCHKMKRIALSIGLLVLVAIGSVWFGYHIRNPSLRTSIRTSIHSVSVTCGGGEYPKVAFIFVNDELPGKIDSLLGGVASHENIVVITPQIFGYCVRFAAPSESKLWDGGTERELSEWISRRMNEIQLEEHRIVKQAGRGDGDKPSN